MATTATTAEVKSALEIVTAFADAIREAKEIPSGHLYAMVMGRMTLEQYGKVIGVLERTGLIEKKGDLLRWKGPELK